MQINSSQIEYVKSIFEILKKVVIIPKTDLEYDNPYTLLVAVILSARSTDKQVNKVTDRLFRFIKTPHDMIKLGIENLQKETSSIGLYRNKSKNIIAMSKMLIEKFNEKIPSTRESLMTLPGIGRKSADVVLNIVFNKPVIAVDTHVAQFARIVGLTNSNNPNNIANELEILLPQCLNAELLLIAHHLMVLYNRHICRGIKNHLCPIKGYCARKLATKPHNLR